MLAQLYAPHEQQVQHKLPRLSASYVKYKEEIRSEAFTQYHLKMQHVIPYLLQDYGAKNYCQCHIGHYK
jgi:hypothetical protein